MRYLSTYKLFENNVTDDFLLDLNDLLVDIKDQNLHIRYLSGNFYGNYPVHQMVGNVKNDRIKLQITKSPTGSLIGKFEITQEVADSLERISDYVKRKGWSFCTYDIHLSGNEWYQMSISDIQHYIGTEVWYIDITITDYRGPGYYERRYGTNESVSDYTLSNDIRDDIESYLTDLEDYGWGYMVNRSTKKMMPSNGKVDYIISVDIWRKNSDTIDIDIIKERINQISDLIKPFEQKEVQIKPKYPYRISMPKTFKYNNLNDYNITELLTGEGEKHTYLRDGVFREIIDDAEFHVKDWGMDEWLDDMQCVGSPTIDSDEIVFISTKQFDDFKVNIPIEDLEDDVRLCIDNIQIKFIYETKE